MITTDRLFWQAYTCGCVSAPERSEDALLKECPKHPGNKVTQQYVSNKARQSVEQINDFEPKLEQPRIEI